jgi:hypothetical protein
VVNQPFSAQCIPNSVVQLQVGTISADSVKHLVATRSKRDLQSVTFGRIEDCTVAALIAELVSTDPHKQWSLDARLAEQAAVALCDAALKAAQSASLTSSLTAIHVNVPPEAHEGFGSLLLALPLLRSFFVSSVMVSHFLLPLLCKWWLSVR